MTATMRERSRFYFGEEVSLSPGVAEVIGPGARGFGLLSHCSRGQKEARDGEDYATLHPAWRDLPFSPGFNSIVIWTSADRKTTMIVLPH